MALSESFKEYRRRVVKDQGEDKNREYYYGLKKKEIEATDENGEKIDSSITVQDGENISIYARYFDASNPNWSRNPEMSLLFLRQQQNTANDILHRNGHLFLNEVYDLLGLPRSEAGQIVGWIDGAGDSFVDFGVYDITSPQARDFVNGNETYILLDFNVDGPILKSFAEAIDIYRNVDDSDDIARVVHGVQKQKRRKLLTRG
jgi:hypothetical protein